MRKNIIFRFMMFSRWLENSKLSKSRFVSKTFVTLSVTKNRELAENRELYKTPEMNVSDHVDVV